MRSPIFNRSKVFGQNKKNDSIKTERIPNRPNPTNHLSFPLSSHRPLPPLFSSFATAHLLYSFFYYFFSRSSTTDARSEETAGAGWRRAGGQGIWWVVALCLLHMHTHMSSKGPLKLGHWIFGRTPLSFGSRDRVSTVQRPENPAHH